MVVETLLLFALILVAMLGYQTNYVRECKCALTMLRSMHVRSRNSRRVTAFVSLVARSIAPHVGSSYRLWPDLDIFHHRPKKKFMRPVCMSAIVVSFLCPNEWYAHDYYKVQRSRSAIVSLPHQLCRSSTLKICLSLSYFCSRGTKHQIGTLHYHSFDYHSC